jgi:spore maturation protein SpmA
MVLNYIWIFFFIIAFIIGLVRMLFMGDTQVFPAMVDSIFSMAKTGFEISLGLTGVLTFWLGLMKVGEKAGVIRIFAKLVNPLFSRLFPELPANHPAIGSMVMNFTANMLGLDNAATPLGLKAMKEMQEVNPNKETASNAQIMFLVINTAGLTLIPVSVMVYRAQLGAADPSDVFLPILIATFCATMTGLITVSIIQRINLFNKVIMAYLGSIIILVAGIIIYFSHLPQEEVTRISGLTSKIVLLSIITGFIVLALIRKVNVYESFIDGAKEGFSVAIKIIPYLIAVLAAIGVFRASGAMDMMTGGLNHVLAYFNINTDFIPALPTAMMKPLSGSGARGMMVEVLTKYGADSFAGRVVSVIQGTTDTTFYIVALYFGSVGVKNTRYAVTCGLIADIAGMTAAILLAYMFFH